MYCSVELEFGTLSSGYGMECFKVSQWSSSSEQVSLLPIFHNFDGSSDDCNLLLPDGISTLTEQLGQRIYSPAWIIIRHYPFDIGVSRP
jgi:hypothetical protein